MMNKIFQFVCTVLVCGSFCACSDDLNELPTQSVVDGNLVNDLTSAENALNGAYYEYAMCGTDYYGVLSTGCCSHYEVYPGCMAGSVRFYLGAYYYQTHGTWYYSSSISLWRTLFKQLNAVNCVISEISKAGSSFEGPRKEEILGEAHGLRALIFYNLLVRFGYSWDINSKYGLILRTEPSVTTNLAQPRKTVKETYDQIISDVDYAIAHAPTNCENTAISQWFAKGLKARVLMLRGQGSDYADAGRLAQDVIENGPYQLEDNPTNIFHEKGLESQEVIFGIQPKSGQSDVIDNYFCYNSAQWLPSDNLLELFKDDPRFTQWFDETQTTTYTIGPDYNLIIETVTTYVLCKHLIPGNYSNTTTEESQYQMRLSELYLILAESMARQNNLQQAKDLLKTILQHAGYEDLTMVENANTQDEVLVQVFNEYMRNLFCESGRELDIMLRFPKDIVVAFNPEYENEQYNVCAIPQEEFEHNSALSKDDQNPGYDVQ